MKIFVSIVSYRDPLLKETIKSILETKSGIHDIVIGVFEQTTVSNSLLTVCPEYTIDHFIRYKRIDPEYSDGVGWARYINSLQLIDEDFFYQIDSHTVFDKDWDIKLIEDFNLGQAKHDTYKIIIDGTCKGFILDENGEIEKLHEPNVTCVLKYFDYNTDIELLAAHGERIPATEDIEPAIHLCAGNFFTDARWVKEVGIDPHIFFSGEEQIMTLDSFAAGYHMYHPRSIESYHFNGTHEYITKHWIEPVTPEYVFGPRMHRSFMYLKDYIRSRPKELLERYYEYSGVDYINQKLDERAFTHSIKKA
jgi:hypothetical protein